MRVTFLTFRADLISRIRYRWIFLRGFIFAYLSFMNVLYIFIYSWFVLQLEVCESRNTYPIFSIFQIASFEYKILNSRLNARRRSKGADKIKRFTFFFLCCLYLYCLISCKIFLARPSLTNVTKNLM